MKLPQLVDYQHAMVAPSVTLLDPVLRAGKVRPNHFGLPSVSSGGLALTFELTVGDQQYAIRCFHKEGAHRRERYAEISRFISENRLPSLVDVAYIQNGIRVDGHIFPIVRMQWVAGARLDVWIEKHCNAPADLNRVRRNIARAIADLGRNGVAHGDLQHGNILVLPDHSVRLIDYDGMYLSSLAQYGSAEYGNRNYQHPDRGSQYDSSMDQFSAAVIDVSLAAVAADQTLWPEFSQCDGERLLFSVNDFADPSSSPLFARLADLQVVAGQASRLRAACEASIDAVPAALAGDTAKAAWRRAPGSAVTAPRALKATDRSLLLTRQGDIVTVVGEVYAVKQWMTRGGSNVTFINFGAYKNGAFAAVAWDTVEWDLKRTIGNLANLRGKDVSVTGLLTVYWNRDLGIETPQIELDSARALHVVTATEAESMLSPDSIGAVGWPEDRDYLLGRLYSSPTFRQPGRTC
jgi:Protein kinase domain